MAAPVAQAVVGVPSGAVVLVLAYVLAGAALGLCSGLTPGLHANNFAMVLAGAAPLVPGPRLAVGAAMLAAGVVHTFLDVVPALALGVPDAAMAATALPGHRLVLGGRGYEALRLSALGSGLAVVGSLVLAVPVTAVATTVYPAIVPVMGPLLGAVVLALVALEPGVDGSLAAALVTAVATGLGGLALGLDPTAPVGVGGVLTPLFAGLFGAPVLIDAAGGEGVPTQADATVTAAPRRVLALAALGAACGALVGYLPGVSSAVAAVVAFAVLPGRIGARGYVVTTSGVNTANTVFALFAYDALGTTRTGVLVAFDAVGAGTPLLVLVGAVVVAAGVGVAGVLALGDRYLRAVGRLDQRRLSAALLVGLAGLSYLFAGTVGVALFVVATLVGLLPVRFAIRRVHLMSVLLGPLALSL